jgi:hypothetical protein
VIDRFPPHKNVIVYGQKLRHVIVCITGAFLGGRQRRTDHCACLIVGLALKAYSYSNLVMTNLRLVRNLLHRQYNKVEYDMKMMYYEAEKQILQVQASKIRL